jgi:secreted trypsin-like serine protease
VHPDWNSTTYENDVALISLETPAQAATPIRLIDPAQDGALFHDGVLAVVAGWGRTKERGQISDALRHVGVQIVSNETCNALSAYGGQIKDMMFCAGFIEGGRDSCQGDSGGPLMAFDGRGSYVLAGVVSWGEGCARKNKYGVYTRLTKLLDWVKEKSE